MSSTMVQPRDQMSEAVEAPLSSICSASVSTLDKPASGRGSTHNFRCHCRRERQERDGQQQAPRADRIDSLQFGVPFTS